MKLDSFSTRAASIMSRSGSAETMITASLKDQDTKDPYRDFSNLQVIPEFIESDQPNGDGLDNSKQEAMGSSSKNSQIAKQFKSHQTSKRSSKVDSPISDEKFQGTPGYQTFDNEIQKFVKNIECNLEDGTNNILYGTFKVVIKSHLDFQYNQQNDWGLPTRHSIIRQDSSFLVNLVKNFIPVIFHFDIDMYNLKDCIPIIPDYMDTTSFYPELEYDSPAFLNLIFTENTYLPKLKKRQLLPPTRTVSSALLKHPPLEQVKQIKQLLLSDSFDQIKIKNQQSHRSKSLNILSPLQPKFSQEVKNSLFEFQQEPREHNSSQFLNLQKNVPIDGGFSFLHQEVNLIFNDQEKFIYKECCKNRSQCDHEIKIAYVTLNHLFTLAFSECQEQYQLILLKSYQKLFLLPVDFAQNLINFYFKFPRNIKTQRSVIKFIIQWAEYRTQEFLCDNNSLSKVILQFLELSLLLNFCVSFKLQQLLMDLQEQMTEVNSIYNKNRVIQQDNQQQKKISTSFRKQRHHSMNQDELNSKINKKQVDQFQDNNIHIHRFESVVDQETIQEFPKNIDWCIYLEASTEILQKQLWIIDFQLINQLQIQDFENYNNYQGGSSKQYNKSALKSISDQFDMLVYHIIFSIIVCPPQLLSKLFGKLIHLSSLSIQIQHYQLAFTLYSALTHDITKSYLNASAHLSLLSQKEFNELLYFGNNRGQIVKKQNLDIDNNSQQLPCIVWLQVESQKLEALGKCMIMKGEINYINFQKLEVAAQIINPILQLQYRASKMIDISLRRHIDQPFYNFFSFQMKLQLKHHLNVDVENKIKIEISLYNLRNQMLRQKI